MTLFGDMGFTVRSSEQALIHMIGVPFKKGNLDTEIPIEERLHMERQNIERRQQFISQGQRNGTDSSLLVLRRNRPR